MQCERLQHPVELRSVSAESKDMARRFKIRISKVSSLAAGLLATFAVHAVDIERPQVQFVDKFGVNMANGQVTHNLSTLSIGGAMGLSHSVSVFANEFNFPGMRGFADKYYLRARNVQLCTSPSACNPMNVMRVEDWSGSQSFAYSGLNYVAISDERHILEVSGSEFLWTKPDGTVVHFDRGAANRPADWGGTLTQVDYPNGFRIWVKQGSVNTNTGFQLKYYFDGTNPPLNKTEPPNLQAPIVSGTWPLLNPKYIRGINAWKVYCPWTTATCAAAGNEWPTAEFEWPPGMPRTMYIGDSLVKVTDSAKRVTTYRFRAYDLAYDEFGVVIPPYIINREFSPRLKEIIPPGASGVKMTYDYKNLFGANMFRLDYRLQSAGVIRTATRLGQSNSYTINQDFMGSDTQNMAGAQGGITLVHQQKYYGNNSATYYMDTLDGRIWYEENGRNFPRQFSKNTAPIEQYSYETRSNLTKVTYNNPAGEGYQILAEYPATCTNRKICNQATRISDPKGNWTDYTYDANSGQVKSITSPANKDGIRPESRFTYALRYATYYNSAGVKLLSTDGIWMKTAEEYCINSAASSGNCAGGDEVVTTFEYNHPNLLMTGMVVTAPGGSRRTCYRYDDFGKQIGVTTPNANLSSCPGVSP
jgi:hypothetical protein